jgi:gluconolactonase
MSPTDSPPAAGFVAWADAFADVVGPAPRLVEVVATDAHEGPVYVPGEDALYFTTARPDVAIRRLALDGERFPLEPGRIRTARARTSVANGMTLGADGRLLVCEQGTLTEPAAITAVDRLTGQAQTVVGAVDGLPLNSPNDVIVGRDGAIWFTDPAYGHLQGFRPPPAVPDRVYRFHPSAGLAVALTGLDKPNGLALSPDERTLYVGDNGAPASLLAYDVSPDGTLSNRRLLATLPPEHPDGIEVDAAGRVYASAPTGVRVFDPDGTPLGEIAVPGAVNFCFGGPRRHVLFITADAAIWAAVLQARGA